MSDEAKPRKSSKSKGILWGFIIAIAVVLIIIGVVLMIINNDYIDGIILLIAGFVIVAIMNINKIHARFMND